MNFARILWVSPPLRKEQGDARDRFSVWLPVAKFVKVLPGTMYILDA